MGLPQHVVKLATSLADRFRERFPGLQVQRLKQAHTHAHLHTHAHTHTHPRVRTHACSGLEVADCSDGPSHSNLHLIYDGTRQASRAHAARMRLNASPLPVPARPPPPPLPGQACGLHAYARALHPSATAAARNSAPRPRRQDAARRYRVLHARIMHACTQHTSAGTAPARNMVNAHNTDGMSAHAGTTRLCTRHLQAQMHVLAHTGVRRRMRAFTLAHTRAHKLHTAGRRARCDHRHALGSPLPLLHCNRAHPSDICTGTGTHPLPDIRRSAARCRDCAAVVMRLPTYCALLRATARDGPTTRGDPRHREVRARCPCACSADNTRRTPQWGARRVPLHHALLAVSRGLVSKRAALSHSLPHFTNRTTPAGLVRLAQTMLTPKS